MKHLALGAAFTAKDVFRYFDLKKLKLKVDGKKRRNFIKQIWVDHLEDVINDCIDNNITFQLPTGQAKSEIFVKRQSGRDFIVSRQHGRFKDVDFLKSNFSGNQLCFRMHRKNFDKDKPIYLNGKLKQKITDKTNEGFQYC